MVKFCVGCLTKHLRNSFLKSEKLFDAALLAYSRGIRMANDEILKGELYSNRSIIFDVTKKYDSCYADCKAAIHYKYGEDNPDRLKKLLGRMKRSEAKIPTEEKNNFEKKNAEDFYVNEDLELKNTPEKGLHVKTKKTIKKNEILFVEENQGFAPIIEDEFQDRFPEIVYFGCLRKLGTLPKVILFLLFEGTSK